MNNDFNADNLIPVSQQRRWSKREKLLLPASLLLAVLFDRLITNQFFSDLGMGYYIRHSRINITHAVFWLCYLGVFYGIYWKRIKDDTVLWFVAVSVVALSVWNFVFPTGNWEYRIISAFVIPGVLMAHAQWAAGSYTMRNCGEIVGAWIRGWFVKPFTGMSAIVGAMGSLVTEEGKPKAKRALIGVGISVLLLFVIVPLLMSADQVFGYYMTRIFSTGGSSSFPILTHIFLIVVTFGLFYSALWNVGFGAVNEGHQVSFGQIDTIITAIVLSSIITVYVLFCIIQFTYLFAGAGLPEGMTFSEYAREGFAQTVVVCAINMFLFGVFLRYSKYNSMIRGLLLTLLALTGVMLVSGWVRLNLYIGVFGMTWLRLLSAWFIIYIAAVVILCAVRLILKKQIPLAATSALMLLVWFIALGYLNPDGFIRWFNYG